MKWVKSGKYNGVVCELKNVRPHGNADRLQLADALGYQVIVGADVKEGQIGILFAEGGKLSHEMLMANNLYRKHPETGEPMGGFFEANGRIRVVKLRKEKSEGFWTSLDSLHWACKDGVAPYFEVGMEFCELFGNKICERHYTAATLRAINKAKKNYRKPKWLPKFLVPLHKKYVINRAKFDPCPDFKKHFDTAKLRRVVGTLPENVSVQVSVKSHGCVSADTVVETLEHGKITIGEVVNNKLQVNIKGMDVTTGEFKFSPVSAHYFKPNDGEWYELELEDGSKLEITGNNPVWIPDSNEYREVFDLKVGDILLLDN